MGSRSCELRGLPVLQQHFRGLQMVFLFTSLQNSPLKPHPVHRSGFSYPNIWKDSSVPSWGSTVT